MNAEVTKVGIFSMQVCVPKEWDDKQVTDFANLNNPAGTDNGWIIRKEGNKLLDGCPERQPCEARTDFVHIMLDC